MDQIKLHQKIEAILEKSPKKIKQKGISVLISANEDARQYFFTKADKKWFDWLWQNGFLDVVKKRAGDLTRYSYRMPEINYLVKIASKIPARVVDFIQDIPISFKNFNPEVVGHFLRICSDLSAKQLSRVIPKIYKENWVKLMGEYNRWGFDYDRMFQALSGAKDFKNILLLAETVLSVRSKKELGKDGNIARNSGVFYFNDLSRLKVFECLISVDDKHAEKALELATKIMSQVVLLGDKKKGKSLFLINDLFPLYDVDFFSLKLGQSKHLSSRNDVRELAAVVKILSKRLIGRNCSKPVAACRLYQQYIKPLPNSRAMWRLRLYVLSLCPKVFKTQLKKCFFQLFETNKHSELIFGAEYQKALKAGFSVLSETDKRSYAAQIFKLFSKQVKNPGDQEWNKIYGWRILSSICEQLTEKEKEKCRTVFGKKCDPGYQPEPSIGNIRGGSVVPKGPIASEEFGKLSISNIVKKLRNEWTPDKLSKQNKSDDFLTPLNAKGVGNLIRGDIPNRLQNYIDNVSLFFERDVLDQHYIYSLLRGIQETLHDKKTNILGIRWDGLMGLFTSIKKSGEDKSLESETRERSYFDTWLSGWQAVHSSIADVLQELLKESDGKSIISFLKYRGQLLETISYLFHHSDPKPKDEELETAKSKTKSPSDKDYLVSDSFTTAINSVRGRTFQAFMMFVFQDGKKFAKKEPIKISVDVKKLYETVLGEEKTQAIMFMFGHYLPSFYYRDRKWIGTLLAKIFPKEAKKKHLYLAAWEGYLSTNLYKEVFLDPKFQKLYERGLALADYKDPKRKYFMELDEGIATHFALAFMHYQEFGLDHPLFKAFWGISNLNRHTTFVSFIGRMFISGDNTRADELLQKEPRCKKRLKKLWDWLLESYQDSKLFVEFGYWMSLKKGIFETSWLTSQIRRTLEKTKGALGWELGLVESISQFAKVSPKDTLEIARLYLFEGGVHGHQQYMSIHVNNEWLEALQILYDNPTTKSGTYNLINNLILEGGSIFWKLKEVVKNSDRAKTIKGG